MSDLEKRLQMTEEKGCFKDPKTGALVFKSSPRERKIDEVIKKIPKLEEKIDNFDDKLNRILELLR